jgi:hypothetical protein
LDLHNCGYNNGALVGRHFVVSFFSEETSPSPSNAWLSKPLAILAAFRKGWDVWPSGPILKVGPHSLSAILDHLDPAPQIPEAVFTATIYSRHGRTHFFLPLTEVFSFFVHLLSRACTAFTLSFTLFCAYSFAHFLTSAMAHVERTACPIDAATEIGSKGYGSGGSAERMESAPLSDVSSHSGAGGDMDEGYHTLSYFFWPLTVMVSHIQGMIDNDYFIEGMGHEPGEETVLEPHSDEAVVFEEFFTVGLRMPPHLFSLISC